MAPTARCRPSSRPTARRCCSPCDVPTETRSSSASTCAGGVARTLIDSGTANGQLSWRDGTQIVTTGPGRGIAVLNTDDGTTSILARPDSLHSFGFPDVLPGGGQR